MVGIALMGAGVVGLVAPGPLGTPLIIVGGVVLWPDLFRKPDRWLQKRMPRARGHVTDFVHRFMDDLNRRYPKKKR